MRRNTAICSLVILTACAQPPAPAPAPVAVKNWPVAEQIEIAKAREQLPPDSILRPLLDDWERMRRELRSK